MKSIPKCFFFEYFKQNIFRRNENQKRFGKNECRRNECSFRFVKTGFQSNKTRFHFVEKQFYRNESQKRFAELQYILIIPTLIYKQKIVIQNKKEDMTMRHIFPIYFYRKF